MVVLPMPLEAFMERQSERDIPLVFSVAGSSHECYLRPPTHSWSDRPSVETEAGQMPLLCLFWDSLGAEQGLPAAKLELVSGGVEIPYGGFRSSDPRLSAFSRKNLPRLTVAVPYLTNAVDIPAGAFLFR